MNSTNDCLTCLQTKDWNRLNAILSDESNCKEINEDPIFQIFESNLVAEVKKIDDSDEFAFSTLAITRIFDLNRKKKILNLSDSCILEIAEYLFSKAPSEEYANLLPHNLDAKRYLHDRQKEIERSINNNRIASKLNVRIGESNDLIFSKEIFNSLQERELFEVAFMKFPDKLIYPNVALSIIIDSKVLELLSSDERDFFFKSTLDLCVVNKSNYFPEYYIELDSSWHDKPRQIENDKRKDSIFRKAGLKLIRLRKKEQKEMKEIFELVLNEHAS